MEKVKAPALNRRIKTRCIFCVQIHPNSLENARTHTHRHTRSIHRMRIARIWCVLFFSFSYAAVSAYGWIMVWFCVRSFGLCVRFDADTNVVMRVAFACGCVCVCSMKICTFRTQMLARNNENVASGSHIRIKFHMCMRFNDIFEKTTHTHTHSQMRCEWWGTPCTFVYRPQTVQLEHVFHFGTATEHECNCIYNSLPAVAHIICK